MFTKRYNCRKAAAVLNAAVPTTPIPTISMSRRPTGCLFIEHSYGHAWRVAGTYSVFESQTGGARKFIFSVMACPHWHWSQSQQKSWLLSPSSSGLSGNYSPGIWGAPASTLVWGSRDTEPLVGGRGKHANPKAFSLLADQGIRQICFLFKEFANSLEDKSVPRFATFVSSFYQSRTGIAYILCLSVSMSVCLSVYMYVNFRFFCDYTSLYLLRDVTLRTVIAKFTEKVETELRKVDK